MLVLSRKVRESIIIGDDIEIKVIGVDRNGQVRIGVEAPRSYRIFRKELLEAIESENQTAAASRDQLAVLQQFEWGTTSTTDTNDEDQP